LYGAVSGVAHGMGTNRHAWVYAKGMKNVLIPGSQRAGTTGGRPVFLQLSDSNFVPNTRTILLFTVALT